ncbi:TadE/TadG family type IV pilus assembly protein [Tropicimonas aquimaris]|uniref:Pilus assembly protein TadG-related protein n=1 Tax=Tropicimonas aquimaris TaxID=914152 RepID=A0ABW3INE8_9RHOB
MHDSKAGCLRLKLGGFRRDEDGSLIVFSLYIMICMMLAIGMALDTIRFEYNRALLQSTLDRAVLAAADLDQTLVPKEVVEDYFDKAGLGDHLDSVVVTQGINHRSVTANASAEIDTMFMDMVGIKTLTVPGSGTADETLADIEIVLVLDNSGSMGSNSDYRLNLLKPAAEDFIDAVARDADDTDGTTAISIVPFATQVTAGKDLMDTITHTGDHSSSYCVTFDEDDFDSTTMSQTKTYRQTAHFDPSGTSWTASSNDLVCSTWNSRTITPWSTDAEYLKGRIDDMQANGWTSIELGVKWGAALLDPSMQDALTALADKGIADEELRGQPFSYDRDNTMKVMVVMSDGENTNQYDIKDGYRSGNSPLMYDSSSKDYTYHYPERSGSYDYWHEDRDQWYTYPDGSNAKYMTWPEVWADMTVNNFAQNIKRDAIGGSSSTYYDQIVESYGSTLKNSRTSEICQAAKDAGVTIFTIGMDTYGQGDATLSDCASAETYFYDVQSLDISVAFAAIALQINQLRLTH